MKKLLGILVLGLILTSCSTGKKEFATIPKIYSSDSEHIIFKKTMPWTETDEQWDRAMTRMYLEAEHHCITFQKYLFELLGQNAYGKEVVDNDDGAFSTRFRFFCAKNREEVLHLFNTKTFDNFRTNIYGSPYFDSIGDTVKTYEVKENVEEIEEEARRTKEFYKRLEEERKRREYNRAEDEASSARIDAELATRRAQTAERRAEEALREAERRLDEQSIREAEWRREEAERAEWERKQAEDRASDAENVYQNTSRY